MVHITLLVNFNESHNGYNTFRLLVAFIVWLYSIFAHKCTVCVKSMCGLQIKNVDADGTTRARYALHDMHCMI